MASDVSDASGFPADLPGLPVTNYQIAIGTTYIGVIAILCAISTLLVAARVFFRWGSTAGVAVDDYFLVVAAILGVIEMSMMISIVEPVIVSRPQFVPFETLNRTAPRTIIAQATSSWSVALTKTSIAFLLIRLQQVQAWAICLYVIIGVQILAAVFVTILHTTRCLPTEAIWNPTIQDSWCWSPEAFKVAMTHASTLAVFTDVVFALIPLTFVRHIRSSPLHRVVIVGLMGLGLLASGASIVKTIMIFRLDQDGDASGHGLEIGLWASIEAQVGIIATCIPCLRAPFLRLLDRLGLRRSHQGGDLAWSIQEVPMSRVGYANSTKSANHAVSGGAVAPSEVWPGVDPNEGFQVARTGRTSTDQTPVDKSIATTTKLDTLESQLSVDKYTSS
ncbi:hypothetical protein OQA88_10984 [Cercophora sp. LCS_1]